MAVIRKLLRLTPDTYAVTIPARYKKTLKLAFGDYVAVYLLDSKTLAIRRQEAPEKI